MTERLVRFGVAMEAPLLEEFDKVVERRGGTRSEAFRDLARAAILRARIEGPIDVMAYGSDSGPPGDIHSFTCPVFGSNRPSLPRTKSV